ncbi:testicular haploid expressed gene protein-like isoform X1 [Salvelinus fontinalis]|uniref:testicular haploid expressed gene protein-like isoform X1 n=2 Tax=Salvelinus fontinalis TaxID=8038 RepID=UPI002486AE75|nr:testicular haploid expressed gene protein-like isoform X1 [Salvelinus fontinalis]
MCNKQSFLCYASAAHVSMATRMVQLAQPKPNLLRFPDRRSVYWLDELPPERNGSTTTFELTPHWSQLCGRKRLHSGFEQSRSSPQWEVSVAALSAYPSNRVCSLALPRLPTVGWEPDRPLLASLSRAVQTAVASPRVCQLACPKRRQGLYSPHSSKTSLAPPHPAATSSRLQLLALPKSDHPQYAQDRPVSWPVPGPVRKAVASERVQVLSQPNQRKALFQGYNPYTVTLAARSASASPRLQELCLPLPRKCKGK